MSNFLEGKVYAAQGEWNRADSSLINALELDPNFASAYGLLISTYLATERAPQKRLLSCRLFWPRIRRTFAH